MKKLIIVVAFVFLAAVEEPTVRVTSLHELTIGGTKVRVPWGMGAIQEQDGSVDLQFMSRTCEKNTEKMIGIDAGAQPICVQESSSK